MEKGCIYQSRVNPQGKTLTRWESEKYLTALTNAEVSRNRQSSKATQGEGRGRNHGQEFGVSFKSKSCVNINGAGSERENPA